MKNLKSNIIPDKTLNKSEKYCIMVGLFVKIPRIKTLTDRDWINENVAAKRLCNWYSDFDFFYYLTEYHNRFNSLLGLASKKMRPELDKKYQEFIINKEKNKPIILEDKPVIDLGLEDKPKKYSNLIEFLDN